MFPPNFKAVSQKSNRYILPRSQLCPTMSTKPARVSFASITPNNLGTVRKLNSVLFPIKYSEKFYQDVLLPEAEDFCKLGRLVDKNFQRRLINISAQFIIMISQVCGPPIADWTETADS